MIWLLIGIGLGLVTLINAIVIVKQKQAKIIERFGKFVRVYQAGIHIKIPFIEVVAGRQSLKLQELKVEVDTITKDKVTVAVEVAAQILIESNLESIKNSFYELSDPYNQIASYIYDEVRAQVPKLLLDEVYEEKDNIAEAVKIGLDKGISQFGYLPVKALVTNIEPDAKVKAAMNEINEQKRLKIAAEEKGEADKILKIKQAEADARSKELSGEGIALQRKRIVEGFKESIRDFTSETNLDSSEVMEFVKITQYFDTLKEMAEANDNVIFVPYSKDGEKDYSSFMSQMIAKEKMDDKQQND